MQTTGNYGLKKPEGNDVVNIDDLNYNADVIDVQLKANANNLANHASGKQTHGISGSFYIAKTSRSDQLPSWGDIPDKPGSFNPSTHTHTKSQITDMPTKLSEFINDIGAGSGVKITTSSTAPTSPSPGDFWYMEI